MCVCVCVRVCVFAWLCIRGPSACKPYVVKMLRSMVVFAFSRQGHFQTRIVADVCAGRFYGLRYFVINLYLGPAIFATLCTGPCRSMLQMVVEANVAELRDGFQATTAAPEASAPARSDDKAVDSACAPISVRGRVAM